MHADNSGNFMGLIEKYNIHNAQKGDSESFEKLVKAHYQTLYRFTLSITRGNENIASDVLQNALIKAFESISGFQGKCSFTSWLWVIIKNEFITHLRKESGHAFFSANQTEGDAVDTDLPSAEENIHEEQRKENLTKMIEQLPENYKEIITMVELSGMSYVEASEFLDIPVGSIKSRLSRARDELHRLVEKNMELF